MINFRKKVKKQIIGFIVAGIFSTLLMYGIYLVLQRHMNYQYAYLISYSLSVIFLYFMNTQVFRKPIKIKTFFEFPFIYLIQYLLGAIALEFFVAFGLSKAIAFLLVAIVLIPLTFLLNRLIFTRRH